MSARRRPGADARPDRGSMSVELVIIAPALVLLLLLVAAGGRWVESHGAIDEEYDMIGVIVAAVVLIALPLFAPTADFVACLVGGAVGGLAGLAASALHPSD